MDGDQIMRRALRVAEECEAIVMVEGRGQSFLGKVLAVRGDVADLDLRYNDTQQVQGSRVATISIDRAEKITFHRPI